MKTTKDLYRIALLTVDWNYELVEKTFHGLKQYTKDHSDVQICVFDCFGKDLGNDKDKSEYAIFSLPDLKQFDGVIVQSNQIVLRKARADVERIIALAGIPAVAIGCELKGCSLIYFDNAKAQYAMTEHIIREHGARRLTYLTGIMDNDCPEGRQRLDGFMAACRDNRIPEENVEVIRCTWRTSDGVNVGKMWLREKYPLPDAFVCANDEMAIGLMATLQEGGIRIPDQVVICGFDNLTSAELSSPRLTTVHADITRMDYYAADVLMQMIRGGEERRAFPFDFELICSESCGCHNAPRSSKIRDLYFQQTRFLQGFYIQQDQMAEDLFEASDMRDLMQIISRNKKIFGCDNIYPCVNEYYFNNFDKSMWPDRARHFDNTMVLPNPDGNDPDFILFPTADLLPESIMKREHFLIFYPLHYSTYSIGYVALNGICTAAKLNLHESIFNFLEIAFENVRKKCLFQTLNDTLDNLYVHDALTGLYNRFGLSRFGQQYYDNLLAAEGTVQILFIDLDNMKTINDKHGHEIGDQALKDTAGLLQASCSENAFIMRYGGDEFVLIDSGRNEDLPEKIQAAFKKHNLTAGRPYSLGLSLGVIKSDAAERRPIHDCIKAADSLMYGIKEKKKTGRR